MALDQIRQAGGAVVPNVQIISLMVSSWAEGAVPQVPPIFGERYAAIEADAKGSVDLVFDVFKGEIL